jgi:hypothetical protein
MRSALLAGAGLLLAPGVVESHEVPARVTVLAYVRPAGRVLRMVVRAPLEAMRDLELPVRGPGYLDIAAALPLVLGAARLWIADFLRVFEEGRALGRPAIVAASLASDRAFDTWAGAEAHVIRATPAAANGPRVEPGDAGRDPGLRHPVGFGPVLD